MKRGALHSEACHWRANGILVGMLCTEIGQRRYVSASFRFPQEVGIVADDHGTVSTG